MVVFSGEVDGYALPNGKGGVANSFSKIAVDSQNGLAATELTQIYNGTTTKLKIIINYKEVMFLFCYTGSLMFFISLKKSHLIIELQGHR